MTVRTRKNRVSGHLEIWWGQGWFFEPFGTRFIYCQNRVPEQNRGTRNPSFPKRGSYIHGVYRRLLEGHPFRGGVWHWPSCISLPSWRSPPYLKVHGVLHPAVLRWRIVWGVPRLASSGEPFSLIQTYTAHVGIGHPESSKLILYDQTKTSFSLSVRRVNRKSPASVCPQHYIIQFSMATRSVRGSQMAMIPFRAFKVIHHVLEMNTIEWGPHVSASLWWSNCLNRFQHVLFRKCE